MCRQKLKKFFLVIIRLKETGIFIVLLMSMFTVFILCVSGDGVMIIQKKKSGEWSGKK